MVFKNIKDLREDNDYNQKLLGDVLGVAQNTYSQYETGVIAFTDEMLLKLADFYGTSVDYLMDRTDEKAPYPPKGRSCEA